MSSIGTSGTLSEIVDLTVSLEVIGLNVLANKAVYTYLIWSQSDIKSERITFYDQSMLWGN